MQKSELISYNETTQNNYIIAKKGLFSPGDDTNLKILERLTADELSSLETILSKPGLIRIIKYFKDYPASTIQACIHVTGTPEASVFRGFKELRELDFIAAVSTAKYPRKGGGAPKIYATRQARPADIASAALIHLRVTQPIYSAVQSTLKACEGFTTSALFREILAAARPYSKGFRINDVAELVAADLRNRGVKVWR